MHSKVSAPLACGKPMIFAMLGDAADIVARWGAGWTCEPGDAAQLEAIIREGLQADVCKLQQMGKHAREAYEAEFAVRIGVDRVERLLAGQTVGADDGDLCERRHGPRDRWHRVVWLHHGSPPARSGRRRG